MRDLLGAAIRTIQERRTTVITSQYARSNRTVLSHFLNVFVSVMSCKSAAGPEYNNKSCIVNIQSGVGDSEYVVSRDPLLINHVTWHMCSAIFTIKMTYADYFYHLLVIRST